MSVLKILILEAVGLQIRPSRKIWQQGGVLNNRKNCSKMNERIENTYTRSGRIANPTEQEIQQFINSSNALLGE